LLTGLVTSCGHAQSTNMVEHPGAAGKSGGEKIGQLGDAAPPLFIQEWIKGRPVKIQPGTNIYVLVFCNLTQANEFALTNLSDLEKAYRDKGLITVAISPEPPEQLKQFIQMRGEDVDFTVAADEVPGRTARSYQETFGQFHLPRAYLVGRDATVLWYGHPLTDDLGEVVDEATSGRYDLQVTRRNVFNRELLEQYVYMARQDDPRSGQIGRVLLNMRTNDAPALCALASKIATDPGLAKRDVTLATAALDRAEQITSTNATDVAVVRSILLFQVGKEEEGLAKARLALAAASGADAKDEVQICIHAMEARLAEEKASQATNHTEAPPAKP
jgi:hypothetical protein